MSEQVDFSTDLRADGSLVARLREADEAAFGELVRTTGPRLLAVARRLLRDEAAAEDAVQESFLAAFRGIHDFEGGAQLSTWLHRIVVNRALLKLRSRRRHPEAPLDGLLPCFDETGHHLTPALGFVASTYGLVEQQETRLAVRRAIDQLPETYRTVLLLRDIEELDTGETAKVLEITTNAVKVRLHRARQALRTLLEGGLFAAQA